MPAEQSVPSARQEISPIAEARDALREAILRGEYLPGERLVEAQLSERFRASRFTVRSALQDLAGDGLVEMQRNRGAVVRKVSLAEAVEITEVRMVLEGLVAARAAVRADAAQGVELAEIGAQMRAAVAAGESRRYSDLNQRLHALIRSIAAHHTADDIIGTLHAQLVRHQFMLSLLPGRPETSLPQHERVIAAILAHDPPEAEAAMRDHISSVIDALRTMDALGL
ncbi:GntR family transcriptional regulator [Catenuloplanes japonicus]|uniref:GntR family transcriptional regulator n=1 Tax=Catenuloplanes japonicus TaxID=33876 RepID=UPI0005244355|nr:GntR family transcriptional regulator [Catenuloplanes japonicus]